MTTHLVRHYLVPGGEPKAFAAPGKSLLVCRVRLRWRRGHTQGMGKVQGEQRCSKGCQGLVQGKQLPRRAGLPLAFPSRKTTCAALQKQGSGTASCQLPTSLKSGDEKLGQVHGSVQQQDVHPENVPRKTPAQGKRGGFPSSS